MIDSNSIESLKSTIDIVDVIGGYIELKKAGANYKANCPFHGEKTASFVVSPQKQIYHCFGCGVGGDSVKFVMEYEKLNYKEAIEKIASSFNFNLHYIEGKNDSSEAKKALESLNLWYQKNLLNSQISQEYLKNRGITQNSIEKFGIGYVPTTPEVMKFLDSILVPFSLSEEIGVLAKGEEGRVYARLTERVTFPIFNPSGVIVGFGGRTLTNHPAKYINSPQTKYFNKSRLLYGYNIAKEHIYANKKIIICEGYLDVIMLHQGGFREAVATLGTALTSEHLPILRKGEPNIVLAYDGDKAGINAALKAARMLSSGGFDGGVVLFPEGMDPADMVAGGKTKELSQLFREKKPLVEFVIQSIANEYDLSNPKAKESAFEETRGYLNSLSEIIKEAYVPFAASVLGVANSLFLKRKTRQSLGVVAQNKENTEILCILKTLIADQESLKAIKNYIHEDMFREYKAYFRAITNEESDNPLLRSIELDEKIKVIKSDDFTRAMRNFLITYYTKRRDEIMSDIAISAGKKMVLNRKIISDIIPRLRRGEMVNYESIGTL